MDTSVLQQLSKGQQVAAGGAVAALVASFLPWYVLKDEFIDSVSIKGTEFTFGWMGMVLFLAAAALVIAPAFGKEIGNESLRGEQIAIGAAALGALLWLIRLVQVPALFFGVMGRGVGLYLAAVAGAVVTAGVVMTMKEKGIAMPKPGDFKTISNGVTTTTPAAIQPGPAQHHAPAQPHQIPAPQPAPAPVQHAAPQPAPVQRQAPQPAPVQAQPPHNPPPPTSSTF